MTQAHHPLIYATSYLSFFVLLLFSNRMKGTRLIDEKGRIANPVMLIVLHIGGIVLMAVVPAVLLDYHFKDIVFGKKNFDLWQVIPIGLLTILAIHVARLLAEKNHRGTAGRGPVFASFSVRFITGYFFVRIVFLIAYETWFRGWLLTDCTAAWGALPAIVLNTALYALLHMIHGKREMLICIPFGWLLCILCFWMHAAWPAILIHLALTLSHEIHLVKKINQPSTLSI
jgi:membrane protease YdiL (CAAX protease family)